MNQKTLEHYMQPTVGIVTAFNPVVDYKKASESAAEAYRSDQGILKVVREQRIWSEDQIQPLLDQVRITGLDKSKYQNP